MRSIGLGLTIVAAVFTVSAELPDIESVPPDLTPPPVTGDEPAPGLRVKQTSAKYAGTDVFHTLYLPTDWEAGQQHPVIVEYVGNGPYRNDFGDVSSGLIEDAVLGYGISGGQGFIWLVLPFISADGMSNQRQWWGDVNATVAYCKAVVPEVCRDYGGNPGAVILAGFSRGSIACNFIGLHDDEVAALWVGFICHSHYDGVRRWNYEGSDRASSVERLKRLGDRPQFISHERSVSGARAYLDEACPSGRFTFQAIPYRNHTASWVLRDIPEREALRTWVRGVAFSPSVRRSEAVGPRDR